MCCHFTVVQRPFYYATPGAKAPCGSGTGKHTSVTNVRLMQSEH